MKGKDNLISMKHRTIKGICLIITAVMLLASAVSCSEKADSAGYISSLNDDGTVTVIGNDGKEYKYYSYVSVPDTDKEGNMANNYFDFRDFGAVGDGTADDTNALKEAVIALKDGGTLYVPAGTYLITDNIVLHNGNITILGDKGRSKFIFNRVQKDSDTLETASLFTLKGDSDKVTIKDITLEYSGEFFGEAGQSYSGKVCGIYVLSGSDIYISGLDVSLFNHSGISVEGTAADYVKRVTIEDSNLHHNRVAGIIYGYVDGLSIFSNSLNYNGAQPDGGTGYGCAGSSAALPRNIQVVGNIANYNYRKGIDLHAGERAIIDGNTCKGNRLYGIYAEGAKTSDIIITNNIISDMSSADTGLESPYNSIYGIAFGVYDETNDGKYHNFVVSNNIIRDFDAGEGVSLPLYCYASQEYGYIKITENIIDCKTIDYLISMNRKSEKADHFLSVDFSSNNISVDELRGIGLIFSANDMTFTNNSIHVKKYVGGPLVSMRGTSRCVTVSANNIVRVDSATSAASFGVFVGANTVSRNNFFNNKAV